MTKRLVQLSTSKCEQSFFLEKLRNISFCIDLLSIMKMEKKTRDSCILFWNTFVLKKNHSKMRRIGTYMQSYEWKNKPPRISAVAFSSSQFPLCLCLSHAPTYSILRFVPLPFSLSLLQSLIAVRMARLKENTHE